MLNSCADIDSRRAMASTSSSTPIPNLARPTISRPTRTSTSASSTTQASGRQSQARRRSSPTERRSGHTTHQRSRRGSATWETASTTADQRIRELQLSRWVTRTMRLEDAEDAQQLRIWERFLPASMISLILCRSTLPRYSTLRAARPPSAAPLSSRRAS